MHDDFFNGMICGCVLTAAVLVLLAVMDGKNPQKTWQQEAILHKAAEWYADDTGAAQFRWIVKGEKEGR